MAIATVERDSTRGSGASEPRFKLVEEVCRTGDLQFWRATDRRSGKPCVVRVIDAGREESSRRLGDLHRERQLAERIAHAAVLRLDVPLIEGERIYQLLQPEPARRIESVLAEGRLAVLNLLAMAAAALAEAHARGAFHGALSRDSLLRTAEGRVIVQGFSGDAANAVAARDGAAADHGAFLALAQDLLAPTGGPPPRLRRYFARELAAGAPRPAADAMASLAEELRDSLEDTFPWPASGAMAERSHEDAGGTARLSVLADIDAASERRAAPVARVGASAATLVAKTPRVPAEAGVNSLPAAKAEPIAKVDAAAKPEPITKGGAATKPEPISKVQAAPRPEPSANHSAPPVHPVTLHPLSLRPEPSAKSLQTSGTEPKATSSGSPNAEPVAKAAVARVDARAKSPMPAADVPAEEPPGRSWRPWLAIGLAIALLVAGWQYGQRRHAASDAGGSRPAVPQPAVPSASRSPLTDKAPAAETALVPGAGASVPEATPPPVAAAVVAPATVVPPRDPPAKSPVATPASREVMAERAREAAAAQATRSRVANLVAGGNRALNALEPQIAADAFAQALALAPNDRAANDGNQRAKRLLGAAALVRDAREAAARGDLARAVQGYSQALANDPRNRGLAEALAASRRSLARDETGTLLAAGHEALGAGRLEQARDAFDRALERDPRDATVRRAAAQAATAILLRDSANERRLAANPDPPEG